VTSMVAVDAPPVKGVELLAGVRPVPSRHRLCRSAQALGGWWSMA